MNIKDITPRDIVKMVWEALPSSQEEHAVVLVDIRDGSVEVIKDTPEFESWAKSEFDVKKVVFGIKKRQQQDKISILCTEDSKTKSAAVYSI